MQKVMERILNLLAFLLTVEHPVTAEEIRYTVKGYDQPTDEAFRRTFERDKDLLRTLGVPLSMGPTDVWEVEMGYVIPQGEYSIPDPKLTDEERTALLIAAQAVRFGGQSTEAAAIFKLGGASNGPAGSLTADLGDDLGLLGDLFGAVTERRLTSFDYKSTRRTTQPYGLTMRFGSWYLHAPERGSLDVVKTFKLDRMQNVNVDNEAGAFTRPSKFSVDSSFATFTPKADDHDIAARVAFDVEIADVALAQTVVLDEVSRDQSAVTVDIAISSPTQFVGWLLQFDDKAVVQSPPELVQLLLDRLGETL